MTPPPAAAQRACANGADPPAADAAGGGVKWKTTLLLSIVTVAVGVYVSRYELKQPAQERREELAKQVVQINADDVTALTTELPDGKVALVLRDGLWHLAGPLQAQADESLIRRALSELNPLTAERVLEGTNDKPLALAEFGLDPPRGIITVTTKDDKTATVWLGNPTPVEDHRYAALPATASASGGPGPGSSKVFVISHNLFDELNQPADAYRSKELLTFETRTVTKVEVQWMDTSWTVEKLDGEWNAAGAPEALDGSKVEAWLWKLRDMKLARFVDDLPATTPALPAQSTTGQAGTQAGAPRDLARYGLDPPTGKILVWTTGQSEPKELLIGGPIESGKTRYGRLAGRSSVVELPEVINELVTTTPGSFKSSQPEPAPAATSSTRPPTP